MRLASDFLLKVPNRYTVPLRQGIDLQDLITGDGTMFETDLDNYGEKINCVLPPTCTAAGCWLVDRFFSLPQLQINRKKVLEF